ncbi:MAG: HAMP domain-containing histidine kinase [Spirochaetes bacterium]|nr:HAMP domain-containing histidine kinase [Deltaproteobacteria bacterium]RKY03791.1 MAG: HAMP domain-containing histidine kinase [Spirochaetota bacterium]
MLKIWNKFSLRARLSLLYVGLLTLSICVVGIHSYWNVWHLLFYNTANHLRAQAKPVIEHWLYSKSDQGKVLPSVSESFSLAKIAKPLAYDLTSRNTVAIILDKNGKILATGKRLPEEPLPPSPNSYYYSRALAGENEVNYQTVVNNEPTLVLLIPLRATPVSRKILGVAQISTSLSPISQILFKHGMMLILVAAITLMAGGGLGFILISSALKNLRKMVNICQDISKGDLSQRVNFSYYHDEIGMLAGAFNNMVARIEAIFESQRRFVANAAHELRTPLTALQGSLEVLLRGSQDDPSAVAKLSRGMYQEVTRLIRLCEQLLGLSRLDSSSNIQKKLLNLNEFFDDFIQQAKLLALDRNVVLKKGPFVYVKADANILSQILFNLIYNAVQHTEEGGNIILGWRLVPDEVEIWVSDDGEGIAPEDIPHIFEPFYQGKSSDRKGNKGAGLGLSLVKAMVEAHSGYVEAKSQLGKGTTIKFNLPLT